MFEFFLALLPIALVLIGIAKFDLPAKIMAPISWVIALASSVFFFTAASPQELITTSINGVLDGARIVWLIFAAFVMLQIMLKSGAMDKIKNGLVEVTGDKRLVVVLLAIPFGTFIEGAAGAGSPAALTAPFLVALGMNPVLAAAACLIGNSAPNSWGGAGVTTVVGAGTFVDFVEASAMTGRMASLVYLILPILMISFVFGVKALKGIWKEILVLGVMMGAINFSISNNIFLPITELTSLVGGFIGTILYSAYLGLRNEKGDDIPEEYRLNRISKVEKQGVRQLVVSLSPYFILCVLLVTVRLSFPISALIAFGGGYTVWVGSVILSSSLIAAIIFGQVPVMPSAMLDSFRKVIPALIAMGFLLAMVNCMRMSGQVSTLAQTISAATGFFYPVAAVLIGQIGGFITGTNLGSNLMFNPLHVEAARNLGLNPIVIVAAQNTGGAIGNMICPHNIIAVCACVSILGREGEVMRKTLVPSIILMLFLGTLAMIYTYLVFPL